MGPQFSGQVWQAFCKALGTASSLTAGYHPQSNSQTERASQDLEIALRCVMTPQPSSQRSYLPHNPPNLLGHRNVSIYGSWWLSAPPFLYPGDRPPELLSLAPLPKTNIWLTDMAPQLPCTNLDRGFLLSSCNLPLQVDIRKLASRYTGPFEVVNFMNLSRAPSFVACVPYLPCPPAQASFPPGILSAVGSCKNIP